MMGVNVNDNEIKKVILDSSVNSNFPKRKDGKNDRVSMVKGLEHGHKYYVTLTVIYSNWVEYETTLTLEKLLENRTMVQVRDKGRFGTFVLKFDTLLKDELKRGEFVQELQVQSDKYFKLISEMNQKIEKANDLANEQKIIADKRGLENSILRADKVMLETQVENQLMVINEQKNEIATLKAEKEQSRKDKKVIGKATWRGLIKMIGMLYGAGKTVDEILEKIEEYLEK